MAELDNCQHDIFVSYAHVDNDPLIEGRPGWVTDLVRIVRKKLAQKLGRGEAYDLWMDWNLKGNDAVTPEILESLGKSAILLMIMSPGYLKSVWCQREFAAYVENLKRRGLSGNGGRLFVVEPAKVNRAEWPEAIQDVKGFAFWRPDPDVRGKFTTLGSPAPDPNERPYWDMAQSLADALADKIAQLRNSGEPQPLLSVQLLGAAKVSPPAIAGPYVFVAEVTGDLIPLRSEVIAYLGQANVPTCSTPLYGHSSAEAFEQALSTDLAKCKVFAQLLSGVSSEKPPGSERSYATLQLESARAGSSTILQWRHPSLAVSAIVEKSHRAMVDGESVLAIGIEQFKAKIVERFREPDPQTIPPGDDGFREIFIISDQMDRAVADAMIQIIRRKPNFDLTRSDDKGYGLEEFSQKLLASDGVVIVYGRSQKPWLDRVLAQIKKAVRREPKARQPLLAVAEGPPPRELPDIWISNTETIDFTEANGAFTIQKFDAFLQRVAQKPR